MDKTVNHGIAGVMWKTVSEACNLACDYCYYSRVNGRLGKIERIDDYTLEKFIREYMEMKKDVVPFAWQGGELLLAGLDFFEKVVSLQAKYAPKNTIISNSIQTNGTLINKKWAAFFKKYNFLVGVSLDGPEEINDARRVTGSRKGSYKLIMRGIEYLKEANIDFNILTVLHKDNISKATELMEFYHRQGFTYVQFLPCMDFQAQDINQPGKYLITPKQYGNFLCEAFDAWYNNGNPITSVRSFDNMLAIYPNHQAEMCTFHKTCPKTIIFEQNGDAYPRDFFIHEDYFLGNIRHDSLDSIVNHEKMESFQKKKPALPEQCQTCEFLHLCHGRLPRNRNNNDSGADIEYFCESYKQIYRYARERMVELSAKVRKRRLQEFKRQGFHILGRNEPCICGSMRKYKFCCEPLVGSLK